MMKYYAVYDTNVLISSLLSKHNDSSTRKVVDAIASQRVKQIARLYHTVQTDDFAVFLHIFDFTVWFIRNNTNFLQYL